MVYCSELLSCCRERTIRGCRNLHKERDSLEVRKDGTLSREKFPGSNGDGGVLAIDQCSFTQPVDRYVQVNFQMDRICIKNLVLVLLMSKKNKTFLVKNSFLCKILINCS